MSEQLSIFEVLPVRLSSSWNEILGNNADGMSAETRRRRWEKWKAIARVKAPDALEYWTDSSECAGCIHRDGDWCKREELPCSVNPYLTIKHGVIGFACMGLGRETIDGVDDGMDFFEIKQLSP